jgi:hypothetical protein
MNRRMFLGLGLAFCLAGQGALAKGFADTVVDQLRGQGFSEITVERTLLGRTRILATSDEGRREIILNPRTGEILRDLWIARSRSGSGSGSGSGGGDLIRDDDGDGSGRGRGRGRGGDDDRESDGDSDRSGSGSGSDDRDDD